MQAPPQPTDYLTSCNDMHITNELPLASVCAEVGSLVMRPWTMCSSNQWQATGHNQQSISHGRQVCSLTINTIGIDRLSLEVMVLHNRLLDGLAWSWYILSMGILLHAHHTKAKLYTWVSQPRPTKLTSNHHIHKRSHRTLTLRSATTDWHVTWPIHVCRAVVNNALLHSPPGSVVSCSCQAGNTSLLAAPEWVEDPPADSS